MPLSVGTAAHSAGLAQEEVVQGHAQRVEVGHELVHGRREAEALAKSLGDVEQGPGSLGHVGQGCGRSLHECRAHAIAEAGCRLQTCRIKAAPVSTQFRNARWLSDWTQQQAAAAHKQNCLIQIPVDSPWLWKGMDEEG